MESLIQDVRYAFRSLLRSRGVTVVALLCLALGIGANTALFSVIDQVLLRPLPYAAPERLVTLEDRHDAEGGEPEFYDASPPNFVAWRERNQVFERMAAVRVRSFNLVGDDGSSVRIEGASVSADFLPLLGVQPLRGRGIHPSEDLPGAPAPVALISHSLWESQLGADPEVLGKTLKLDGAAHQVIGILPPGFRFPEGVETPQGAHLWTPLGVDPEKAPERNWHNLMVVARLRPGVSVEQARGEMDRIATQLARDLPDSNTGWGVRLRTLSERTVGDVRPVLLSLLAAVGFVLLMACTNVAGLLLARAAGRHHEIAVRSALGAGRFRLLRQLLTESLVLSIAGGLLGFLLAVLCFPLLVSLSPVDLPRAAELGIDLRMLGFTLLVAVVTGLLFGLTPALQASRADLYPLLRQGGGRLLGAGSGKLAQGGLVVVQIGLVVVLLVSAGLMLKSFHRLRQVDPGFDVERRLTLQVWPSTAQYPERHLRTSYYQEVMRRVAALPGVEAVSGTSTLPVGDAPTKAAFVIEGRDAARPGEVFFTNHRRVRPGYFEAMGIRLLRGRLLSERDDAQAAGVVVISQAMAEQFWPGEDPLGRRVKRGWSNAGDLPWLTVVGVVEDVRDAGLSGAVEPTWYLPEAQHDTTSMSFVVRTATEPLALAPAVQKAMLEVDPEQPVFRVATLEELLQGSISKQRFGALVLGAFAALGLLLAAAGIYGVLSYMVARRFREMGLRMALGADRTDVLLHVLRYGATLAGAGLALGLVAAVLLTRLLSGLLFEVSPTDPATLAGMTLFLAAVALVAVFLPARRVTRVDPVIALRQD